MAEEASDLVLNGHSVCITGQVSESSDIFNIISFMIKDIAATNNAAALTQVQRLCSGQ